MRELYRELYSRAFQDWTRDRALRAAADALLLVAFVLTSSWVVHP